MGVNESKRRVSMRNTITVEEPLVRLSAVLCGQAPALLGVGTIFMFSGLYLAGGAFGLPLIASGATLASLAGLGRLLALHGAKARHQGSGDLQLATGHDPVPCIGSARDGSIWYLNPAARTRFQCAPGGSLVGPLGEVFADPDRVLLRLQDKARALGAAVEEAVSRNGKLQLTVVDLDGEGFLWRFDESVATHGRAEAGRWVGLPMLAVDPGGAIGFSNEPMRRLLGQKAKHVDRVLTDFPVQSGAICSVMTAAGAQPMRIVATGIENGRQELYFLPPDGSSDSVADGTSAATEDLPVGLLELAADGRIATANRLARELLQLGDTADLGEVTLGDRLEGLGRPVRDWLEEAVKGRGLGKPEVLRVSSDDVESFLKITLGPVSGRGEVRLLAVLNDATELKTLEAQFVQSQKMQAIGQLAGGVAHDFNNLLTAISGHCDLMLLRHDQGDPDYGDLVQIHQNANRAASLVGQLLAFSRKQTLQPQIIDLRDTLSDLTHLLNRLVGERISLTLHHEIGLPTIRADRRQLEQVIMNLVVNARDAMPEGGEIRIETMERTLGDGLTRDRAKVPPGRYVVVKVEDHGSGIATDKIGKIFEPFYTTKRTGEGTGLGLSTAYGIVKQSEGFIFVDSVVGTGTAFTLYFPAHDRPADVRVQPGNALGRPIPAGAQLAAQPTHPAYSDRRGRSDGQKAGAVAAAGPNGAASPGKARHLPGDCATAPGRRPRTNGEAGLAAGATAVALPRSGAERILHSVDESNALAQYQADDAASGDGGGVVLLVEDEAPVRAFASRALRLRGYTVIEAKSAEEALETLEDPALKVDVFVTDVIMPGMDGPSWVRLALRERPDVKVIFVSGYAEDSFSEEQARIPNSVFLPKPFSLGELTATVQDQIN
jgi:two-component system cell cycle sensor histidine kinase/response regulator CckA